MNGRVWGNGVGVRNEIRSYRFLWANVRNWISILNNTRKLLEF